MSSSSSNNCPAFNCTSYPALNPNPDISGIGVLIGFLASAYITIILSIILYLTRDIPTNPLDTALTLRLSAKSQKWTRALEPAIVTLGDQQIVAGLSVLISAYVQLPCALSIFHWQMAAKLAWFSSVTHLATLSCLRRYFHARPAVRLWRLIAMALTAVLLVSTIVPEGYISNQESVPLEFPAQCLWHPGREWAVDGVVLEGKAFGKTFVAISLVWLVASYVARVFMLFPGLGRSFGRGLKDGMGYGVGYSVEMILLRWEEDAACEENVGWGSTMKLKLATSLATLGFSAVDFFGSMLWELTALVGALVYGTIRIFMLRASVMGNGMKSVIEQEDVWGFGQVVAVILLVLPFISYFEMVYELGYSIPSETVPSEYPNSLPTTITFPSDPIAQSLEARHSSLKGQAAYSALLFLEYIMLLVVAGDFMYLFPYYYETRNYSFSLSDSARSYVMWFSINAALLWMYAFIFLDSKVEDSWTSIRGGKWALAGLSWNLLLVLAGLIAVGISAVQRYI